MKTVLFICTGNTCRSPMAEILFNDLCEKRGLPYRAASAGLHARDGAPASGGAKEAMRDMGLSLLSHSARPVTRTALSGASLVITMSPEHARALQERFGAIDTPVVPFVPAIPDPFMGSKADYARTAQAIAAQLDGVIGMMEA